MSDFGISAQLIVSIHDVTQHNVQTVKAILRDLEQAGIRKTSLLVIPNYHRRGPISAVGEVSVWLYSLAEQGHEIILHGYTHHRQRHNHESLRDRIITRFYTSDEGEFYDLSEFEAEQCLKQGSQILRDMGLSASGFIAPAWLLSEGGRSACRATGFQYTVLYDRIIDFITGSEISASTLVYSTRALWRRYASRIFNHVLSHAHRKDSVLRISIHPPDYEHPAIWRQTLKLSKRSVTGRRVMTYLESVMARRNSAGELPHSTQHFFNPAERNILDGKADGRSS